MKVWINKRYDGYSGGMIIVAANTAEEAHETLHDDSNYDYLYYKVDDDYKDYHYEIENWVEVPNLVYEGDKPCVIAEDGYTE